MITGAMGFALGGRLKPRLETGELAHQDLATEYRVERWLKLAPRIGNNVFLKLHTHGGCAGKLPGAAASEGGLDGLFELLSQSVPAPGTRTALRQHVGDAQGCG